VEIRLEIFTFLLTTKLVLPWNLKSIGILLVNRQLYNEARAVLYGTNPFSFSYKERTFRKIRTFSFSLIRKLELKGWHTNRPYFSEELRFSEQLNFPEQRHWSSPGEKLLHVIQNWLDRNVDPLRKALRYLATHCYSLYSLTISLPHLVTRPDIHWTWESGGATIELFTSSPPIRVEMEKIKSVVRELTITTSDFDEAERVARIMRVKNLKVHFWRFHLLPDLDEPNYSEVVREIEGKGWLVRPMSLLESRPFETEKPPPLP
jgi:hypothetical protein